MTIKFHKNGANIDLKSRWTHNIDTDKLAGFKKAAGIRNCGSEERRVWIAHWDSVFDAFAQMAGITKSQAWFGFMTGDRGFAKVVGYHQAAVRNYQSEVADAELEKRAINPKIPVPRGMDGGATLLNGEMVHPVVRMENDDETAAGRIGTFWDRVCSARVFDFDLGYDVETKSVRSRMPREDRVKFKRPISQARNSKVRTPTNYADYVAAKDQTGKFEVVKTA